MDGNQFVGSIPTAFSRMKRLGTSKEAGMDLNDLYWSLKSPTESLFLFNNRLSGSLPSEIGNLTKLENLRVEENALTGMLPIELGDLTKLGKAQKSGSRTADSKPVSSCAAS